MVSLPQTPLPLTHHYTLQDHFDITLMTQYANWVRVFAKVGAAIPTKAEVPSLLFTAYIFWPCS
jgi:hypothetical protein